MVCFLPFCGVRRALSAPNPGLETRFHSVWLVIDSGLAWGFTPMTDCTVRDAVARSSRVGVSRPAIFRSSFSHFHFSSLAVRVLNFVLPGFQGFCLQTWPVKEACDVA